MDKANASSPGRGMVDVMVGVQWGDEGKGRVVDYYAGEYDIVARFGGGDNAGHTIIVGDRTLKLRIVPSGVLQSRPTLFIGGGTVVALRTLVDELDMLAAAGVDVARVKVSDRAHVVLPYHLARDRATEEDLGAGAIGTTRRGIGPAYIDKAARLGLRIGDVHSERVVSERVRVLGRTMNGRAREGPSDDDVIAETLSLGRRIRSHLVDGVAFLHEALGRGSRVLAEGAQGTLLDVGYGTYPFVTSSVTVAGGACSGLGIGPRDVADVVGVAKAYCTRVGAGPLPSELHDDDGERLRTQGAEFGTVTGRPRRCGWFDAVAARYASRVNGLSSAVITKLDVLDRFERIGIVVAYEADGAEVPFGSVGETAVRPRIEWYQGWRSSLAGMGTVGELPVAARRYVDALQSALDVPVVAVSTGPERRALAVT